MNIPHRRWLAVAAVIIASIGVFVAPYLMHGSPAQSNSSPNSHGTTTTTTNPNNGNTNPGQSSTTHGTGSTATTTGTSTSGTTDTTDQTSNKSNCGHHDKNEKAKNNDKHSATTIHSHDTLSVSLKSTSTAQVNHGNGHNVDSVKLSHTIDSCHDKSKKTKNRAN